VLSIEFLDPSHHISPLRPADSLEVAVAGSFYSPKDSYVSPAACTR
jgi:hypothetical protein